MPAQWSIEVSAERPYRHTSEKGVLDLRSCFFAKIPDSGGASSSKLSCAVGKTTFALCRLTSSTPTCRIGGGDRGLVFEEDVTLTCEGATVRLAGIIERHMGSGGVFEDIEVTENPVIRTSPKQAVAAPPQNRTQKRLQEEGRKEAQPLQKKAKTDPAPAGGSDPRRKEERLVPRPAPPEKKKPDPAVLNGKKRLASGLQYEVLKAGKSNVVATNGKTVKVKYEGRLAKSGKRFDKGTIPFRLGTGEVIRGWDEGVKGMVVGESRRLMVPAHLGYGRQGAPGAIPPNADLVFECELLNVR